MVPLLALGGKGVISVVSNVKPELVHNCCKAFFDGDTAKARKLQLEMLPLADALFCEVNPIPVKYAMNVLGWEAGECRLPLVEPSEAHKEQIERLCVQRVLLQNKFWLQNARQSALSGHFAICRYAKRAGKDKNYDGYCDSGHRWPHGPCAV